MKILFTTGTNMLSKAIKALTRENVSHCAIEAQGFVVHSTLKGVIIEPLSTFKKINEIVDTIDVGDDNQKLLKTLAQAHGKSYDILALLYIGLKLVLGKVGIKLPKKNLWQTTGMYLCTEFVTHVLGSEEDSDITPGQLRDKLRSKNE